MKRPSDQVSKASKQVQQTQKHGKQQQQPVKKQKIEEVPVHEEEEEEDEEDDEEEEADEGEDEDEDDDGEELPEEDDEGIFANQLRCGNLVDDGSDTVRTVWTMKDGELQVDGIGEGIARISHPHPEVKVAFASSYMYSSLSQTISVMHIPTESFKKTIYGIRIEFWVASRHDQEAEFKCSVKFDDKEKHLVDQPVTLPAGTNWSLFSKVVAFPIGVLTRGRVDTIIFIWQGKDKNCWAGHYGAKVTNLSLCFVDDVSMAENPHELIPLKY
ncbi:hypothetical protein BCR33DRAFT_847559 [Rhizoclosmatium globosum]|uniref:FBA domain-containing protein n=1 Tax=Rhizoclosmatium globosum TaxID=329046 RepID=A0A1Y2CRG2_9FUNG|nr:hypothetical protein BCR33DRAFT_847559 [Rhizoclosmatium globosum]|eukprot:ORY49630.1 hypothetical protein BCR33DRAFT_847559 [Rhizoclosmatium globosum]